MIDSKQLSRMSMHCAIKPLTSSIMESILIGFALMYVQNVSLALQRADDSDDQYILLHEATSCRDSHNVQTWARKCRSCLIMAAKDRHRQ